MPSPDRHAVRIGRGAASNPPGRFEPTHTHAVDDGWTDQDATAPAAPTSVMAEAARSIITRNRSPDVPFSQSINPYRGCEHGCIYCYARPSHAVVGLSPGLDFETRLFYKRDAAALLRKALAASGYRCAPIALGANTDPYQPIEGRYRVTRDILETLSACHHPASIVTKGARLILRDLELLADMGRRNLLSVHVSVTTLDRALKRRLEPRASAPAARLSVIRALTGAGVPVGVLVAPVIPALTDHELENILQATADAGASTAHYTMLRLPYEVKTLFRAWLEDHVPLRASHVMARIHDLRGGRDNDPRFGIRHRGQGVFADLFARRFEVACRRLGLNQGPPTPLDTSAFVPPQPDARQRSLF